MKILQRLVIYAVLIGSFGAVFALATPAYAGPFDDAKTEACKGADTSNGNNGCDATAGTKLSVIIKNIINLLSIIVGIAAIIVIIVSGLRFITAGGDANSISSARNGVIYAVVGLIVAALAQVIVRFVLSKTS
jgi:nitrate/nitrite transporter NarK